MKTAKDIFDQQCEEIEKEKERFNESIRKRQDFEVCDIVLILKRVVKKGHVKKLTHLWRGPYIITNKLPNNINYEVELLCNGKDKHIVHASNGKDKHIVHASNIKLYNEPHNTHLSKTLERMTDKERVDTHKEKEYEVESILDKQREHDRWWYLVKWKDFGEENNLVHCKIVQAFERDFIAKLNTSPPSTTTKKN